MVLRMKSLFLAGILVLAAAAAWAQVRPPVSTRPGTKDRTADTGAAATPAQALQLRPGEAALYLRTGEVVIDKIVDISSTRLVVETAKSGEFGLGDVWMINYEASGWSYPAEFERLGNHVHTIFTKDGRMLEGQVVDFSSTRLAYQFESGEEVPAGDITRIYFTSLVPASLRARSSAGAGSPITGRDAAGSTGRTRTDGRIAGGGDARAGGAGTAAAGQGAADRAGRGQVEGRPGGRTEGRELEAGPGGRESGLDPRRLLAGTWAAVASGAENRRARGFQLQLEPDGTAQMSVRTAWGRSRKLAGRWSVDRGREGNVTVELDNASGPEILVFSRDGELLVGRTDNRNAYGALRLRRLASPDRPESGAIRR